MNSEVDDDATPDEIHDRSKDIFFNYCNYSIISRNKKTKRKSKMADFGSTKYNVSFEAWHELLMDYTRVTWWQCC